MSALPLELDTWLDLPTPIEGTASERMQQAQPIPMISGIRDWVSLPEIRVVATPIAQLQAQEVLAWTGLSMRQLSSLIGTTHPTLKLLTQGVATQLLKKPGVPEKLAALHRLCERIVPLAGFDSHLVASTLLGRVEDTDLRIADLAVSNNEPLAYIESLRRLAPRAEAGLPEPYSKREAGEDVVPLDI